jgi:Uncharacterized protein conserved in bacteria
VSEFIEECRREWKRLGVPSSVANEMAADLAADLQEADDEGVSPEEVLGSGAFDPQSFAASWAAERGVVDHPRSRSRIRKALLLAALALVLAAGVGLVAARLVSDSDSDSGAPASGPTAPAVSVTVPHLVGLDLIEAIGRAESLGFSIAFAYRDRSKSPSETVIAQKPAAGAKVTRGAALSPRRGTLARVPSEAPAHPRSRLGTFAYAMPRWTQLRGDTRE